MTSINANTPAAVESCPAPMPDRISCSGRNSNSPSSAPVPSTAVAVCRNRSVCPNNFNNSHVPPVSRTGSTTRNTNHSGPLSPSIASCSAETHT